VNIHSLQHGNGTLAFAEYALDTFGVNDVFGHYCHPSKLPPFYFAALADALLIVAP
jgi:hypothetical protein